MIVDCSIFSKNLDLIEMRLDLFNTNMDKYIFFLESEIDLSFIEKLKIYNLDIDFVIMDKFRDLEEITKYIVNLNLSYEDVIFFSEENEFIDLNQMDEIVSRLQFSPVIISHKKFIDDGELINFERVKGTTAYFYHQIKFQENILQKILTEKGKENFRISLPLESGFLA